MSGFLDTVLHPLELAVAYIMVGWHSALTTLGMDPRSGWTWALSIVGLVIVVRILLIPLFVRQIKASRGLQLLQPEMKKIQEKYKGKTDTASRQAQQQEIMALYRETGTNPFASCLPILLQSPVFFALFRVLNGIGSGKVIGPLTAALVTQADNASLFGGAQLSESFMSADTLPPKILSVVLIVLMSLTTYTTQRQLMMKNMPPAALEGPFAQQQKILLYVFPVIFAVTGVNFPIGVLIYWLTTNLWTMGQQFYVIRRMPAPGSPADKALQERRRKHGKASPQTLESSTPALPTGQRQQPKRQPRSKRTPPGTPAPRRTEDESAEPASGDGSTAVPAPTGKGTGTGGPGGSTDAPSVPKTPATPKAPSTPSGPVTGAGAAPRGNGVGRPGGSGQSKNPSQPRRSRPSRPKR